MKNNFFLFAAVSSLGLVCFTSAHAQVSVNVYTSVGPNFNGSPSFSGYSANAISALEGGSSSAGNINSPAYYSQTSTANANQTIATPFNSWAGSANPTGAFSGEYGNSVYFSADIKGNGTKISLDKLSYTTSSTDGVLNGSGNFSGDSYNANRVGIIYGTGGNPNTYITSGSGSQLVDEIVYTGVSVAYDGSGYPGATNQDQLNAAIADVSSGGNFNISGSYTYDAGGPNQASGSANLGVTVPEPAAAAVLGVGVFGLIGFRYLRRKAAALVCC